MITIIGRLRIEISGMHTHTNASLGIRNVVVSKKHHPGTDVRFHSQYWGLAMPNRMKY